MSSPPSPNKTTFNTQNDEIAYIKQLLACKKYRFAFPESLEKKFIHKRATESQDFINTGRYALILLFLIIVANVTFYFEDIVFKNNYQIIKDTYLPLVFAIGFVLFSPLITFVKNNFYSFIAPCAVFILYHIIFLVLRFDNAYSEFVVYHLMMAIILMAFGLRFVLPVFILVLIIASLISFIHAWSLGLSINYAKFSNYYILYCCVVVALTAISEWHERLAFAQSLLLDYHSEKLNLLNKELEHIAHEDALTGINNRRSFDELTHKEWDRALRDAQPTTLLLIDVDFFKLFNDHYGHSAGDDCLHQVAQTLQKLVLRSSDVVARYGGEEFVILLPNTKAAGGIQVAQRIIEAVDALKITHQPSDVSDYVSISVGVTTLIATKNATVAQLIHQADIALYKAKNLGRHRYVIYEQLLAQSS